MVNPFTVLASSLRRWWADLTEILFLNSVWLLLQLTIIAGPPATAVIYAMMNRTHAEYYWGWGDFWREFKRLFWPAWRWGLLNLMMLALGLFNLAVYWPNVGLLWTSLRFLWIGTLSVWVMINLFYWPFWLAQEDRSMRTTYANCFRFLLLNPLSGLALSLICITLLIISSVTLLPLILGAACFIALVGIGAVQQSLEMHHLKQ